MWVKLDNEFVNLDNVTRIKFTRGWKNDSGYLVAELETLTNGEIRIFTRYRSPEAEVLQAILLGQESAAQAPAEQPDGSCCQAATVAEF